MQDVVIQRPSFKDTSREVDTREVGQSAECATAVLASNLRMARSGESLLVT